MREFVLTIEKPLHFEMTGKFVSPSAEWKHMSRVLMEYELFVITHGVLYMADDYHQYEVREGEYLIMPPRSKQYGYAPSDCSFYWLHFQENGSQNQTQAPAADPSPFSIALPEQGVLGNKDKLVVMMKQLQNSVRSYGDAVLNHYLATGILCELHNQIRMKTGADQSRFKRQQLFNDIADYVKWHRFEPLQVSQIAVHFGYNVKYISQMFANISGVTLKRYIMQQKMDAAAFLLTDTNMTISEIAMQLGYHDNHHFMKTFKLLTNVTPSEYRNSAANRVLNH